MTAYQVVATPADGYQFMGWYDVSNKKYISTSAKAALNIDSDCTITARFASKTAALFETGGQPFDNLGDAVTYAQANGQSKITLAADGSISGSYTIPAGITLLIPFDAAGTLYTDAPAAIRTTPESKPFRTLTMSEGTSITVNGAISLGGRYFAAAGSQQGRPVGDYGYIKMADNSSITVKNGGKLYAWGFISGSGSVLAESGATVYEFYQIADFRGGSASANMGNKVFPFSQYFVQNIEVPLTLNAGANEQVYSGVFAMSSTFTTAINFIGDNGMFKLTSGSFTKDYDEKTDRLVFTVNGEAALNTLSLKLAGQSVNSASYVLPITNNITINIQSGNVTINQDAALLAGVEVNIAEGAGLTVANGKNIYFYDSDEWNSDNFVWGPCKFKSVAYAPGKAYNRTNNDLVDAKMDVNGSVTAIGAIYTTEGGADICSSNGTGKYIQQGTPGTETETYQYNANGNKAVTIPITAAKLHNAGDSYTGTAGSKAGDTYVYANGKWALRGNEITITFDPNGGAGSMEPMSVNPGVGNKLIDNTFTRENYTFTGWNTAKDGTGKTYADGETVNFSADTTLYAQWTQNPVITFDANGGKGTMGTQTVKPNEATDLTANSFTRADYDFTGWNTAKDGTGTAYADKTNITTNENVTLYAQWTLHKYHVRWLNWDDTVLQDGYYTCEEEAKWDDWNNDPPSRPEDENYTYVFAGRWTPYDETKGINGWGFNPHEDVDFKAVFNEFKKLTVTFDANGGIGTMDSVKIANGGSGKYYMLPECGFTREGYTFNGWLITGTVKMSVWDEEEELNDEPWTESELLALSDLTLKASWKHSDGWFTDVNGKQYYKNGELQKTGWTVIDDKTYYLDTETGYAATGIATLIPDGATEEARCVFDAEGVFQSDVTGVYSVGADTYWLNSGIIEEEAGLKRVVKENGEVNYYYFGEDGKAVKKTGEIEEYVVEKNNGYDLPEGNRYCFDENGVIVHFSGCPNGIYRDNASCNYYYCVDGVIIANGLMKIDGNYYYARTSNGAFVCNRTYWITKTNGLLDAGIYTFDDAGRIIFPEKPKNGIVAENGSLYYYENGVLTGAGLIQIGNDYYYVRTSTGEVVHGRSYWVTDTNDLLPAGPYTFDTDGKMINPPVVDPNPDPDPTPDVKNGIVAENGSLYYYENGVLTGAGLIQLNGDYYYVKTSNCEVVHGRSYWITVTNGLLPTGQYMFADNGKLIR